MTDQADQPLDVPITDAYVFNAAFPAQQGETLGRYLDPVRAKALHEAVNLFPYLPEPVSGDPVGEILTLAERFEAYLDPTAGDARD